MKEIRTKKYAQVNGNLPGDPMLPPGISNGDISKQYSEPSEKNDISETEQFEIHRNWDNFKQWYGPQTGEFMPTGDTTLNVTATYYVTYSGGEPDISIRVKTITDLQGNDFTKFGIGDKEEKDIKTIIIELLDENNIVDNGNEFDRYDENF